MKVHPKIRQNRLPISEHGFSLAELMIASAIGLVIVAGMSYVFLSSSQSRNEIEKESRQIENGRYAIETLRSDIQLAGFYGEYPPTSTVVWTTPDPCSTVLSDMGFASAFYSWNTTANTLVPVGVQGYTDTEAAPGCISNRKPGTDILVIRRAGTVAIPIDADENGAADANVDTDEDGTTDAAYASLGAGFHLQISHCSDIPAENTFVMDHDTSKFTLHKVKPAGTPPSCLSGGLSTLRKFYVHLYYVSTCNDCTGTGDGVPTLKVVELAPATSPCAAAATVSCGAMSAPRPIAEGIEDLQFEYGVDNDDNGTPDTFTAAAVAADDWKKVVSVKVFLLARNADRTPGYADTKKYVLNSAGTETGPFNDSYKRHVYSSTIMATNIAGRKLP